jgi:hypothetical protein
MNSISRLNGGLVYYQPYMISHEAQNQTPRVWQKVA